ncbi:hypothetical protein F5Y18DRAFT_74450 [Xylariaceae sp. FL1019]|nr:hypothetical protein F5Y18DRAFT_74450 [Xylariaceae sp. FL1019]
MGADVHLGVIVDTLRDDQFQRKVIRIDPLGISKVEKILGRYGIPTRPISLRPLNHKAGLVRYQYQVLRPATDGSFVLRPSSFPRSSFHGSKAQLVACILLWNIKYLSDHPTDLALLVFYPKIEEVDRDYNISLQLVEMQDFLGEPYTRFDIDKPHSTIERLFGTEDGARVHIDENSRHSHWLKRFWLNYIPSPETTIVTMSRARVAARIAEKFVLEGSIYQLHVEVDEEDIETVRNK